MNLNLGVVLEKMAQQGIKKREIKKLQKEHLKVENLYFRKDRLAKPLTLLKCIEIKKDMGWCDDLHFPRKI
jgi:hypothetical protein